MKTTKIVLIDTNVILNAPKAIYDFKDSEIVIPLSVIAELDTFKKSEGDLGANSRAFIRDLDKKRLEGDLRTGIKLNNNSLLRVISMSDFVNPKDAYADTDILTIATHIKQLNQVKNVIIVSNDLNLRIRASAIGLLAESYDSELKKNDNEDNYKGYVVFDLTEQQIEDNDYINTKILTKDVKDKYVYLNCSNKKKSMLLKLEQKTNEYVITESNFNKYKVFGLAPKSIEQLIAMDMLIDDEVKLVMIGGKAGCGKTFISTLCGIDGLVKEHYETLYISKTMQTVGNEDCGALPGDLEEKLAPYYQSFMDAIKTIKISDVKAGKSTISEEIEQSIEYLPFSFLRGRSISNALIICDEVQNVTIGDLKTLVTRAGENCKVVLLADVEQIDNCYLDKESNGFTKIVKAFKDQTISSYIRFEKCERSKLAEIASKVL